TEFTLIEDANNDLPFENQVSMDAVLESIVYDQEQNDEFINTKKDLIPTVNLTEAFKRVVDYVMPEMKSKNVSINFTGNQVEYFVKAHLDSLEQILFNTIISILKSGQNNETNRSISFEHKILGDKLSFRMIYSRGESQGNAELSKD